MEPPDHVRKLVPQANSTTFEFSGATQRTRERSVRHERGCVNVTTANHSMFLYLRTAPSLREECLPIRQNVSDYILAKIQLFRMAHRTRCSLTS